MTFRCNIVLIIAYITLTQIDVLTYDFDNLKALATELDKEKSEEERKLREIQRICENSPELRELEQALKVAYLNKVNEVNLCNLPTCHNKCFDMIGEERAVRAEDFIGHKRARTHSSN